MHNSYLMCLYFVILVHIILLCMCEKMSIVVKPIINFIMTCNYKTKKQTNLIAYNYMCFTIYSHHNCVRN